MVQLVPYEMLDLGEYFSGHYNVKGYGAAGDDTADDRAALQTAIDTADAAGGGVVFFPPGRYKVKRSLIVPSNVTLLGCNPAAAVIVAHSAFEGTNAGNNCYLVRNENHTAVALTDESIHIEGLGFDYVAVTIVGGGAHAISMRYVDRVTVRGCHFNKGENGTALLACNDTLVENCHAVDFSNCAYDHWDGAGNATVTKCSAVITSGDTAQGIQFTGTGSLMEDRTSTNCVVSFNRLSGIRNSVSNTASAIICNVVDAGSSAFRFRSIGNLVEDSDIGLVFGGDGGQHLSQGDTFRAVDQLPIFLQRESAGEQPNNCRVLDAHLIDCDHEAGNVAMVSISGTGHEVRGLRVSNTVSAAYASIVWLTSYSTNCFVEITSADTGSGSRTSDSGTTNTIVDDITTYVTYSSGTYNPNLSFGDTSGATSAGITYGARGGWWKRLGDEVTVHGFIKITSKGSATGEARISLPFTCVTGRDMPGGFVIPFANNFTGLGGSLAGNTAADFAVINLTVSGSTGTSYLSNTPFGNDAWLTFSGTFTAVPA